MVLKCTLSKWTVQTDTRVWCYSESELVKDEGPHRKKQVGAEERGLRTHVRVSAAP